MELGYQIAINNGIPDSLSYIPDCKTQNSGFHNQKSSGFRNPLHGLDPRKYKQSSPVSSSKWLQNESTKMRLFEVIYQSQITVKESLLIGLFIIVYFQISGAFLLP